MPLILPTLRQISDQIGTDLVDRLPGFDPSIPSSMIRAVILGVAIRINAAHFLIRQAVGEAFPQTATGENLERFAEGISRNPASGSAGNIVLTGTALSVVPLETALTSQSGQVYRTQATVTLTNQITTISALSSTAGVATAVANGHPYVLIHLGHWAWWMVFVFGTLTTRVVFEGAILLFRTYDRLGEIRDALQSATSRVDL